MYDMIVTRITTTTSGETKVIHAVSRETEEETTTTTTRMSQEIDSNNDVNTEVNTDEQLEMNDLTRESSPVVDVVDDVDVVPMSSDDKVGQPCN